MIFKPEMVEKILAGEKTVTRRTVKYRSELPPGAPGPVKVEQPCKYKVGKDYAVQPGRGQKGVGRIRILSVDRGPLENHRSTISALVDEGHLEGFRNWFEFRDYWRTLYDGYDPTQLVDRIEFELLPRVRKGKSDG